MATLEHDLRDMCNVEFTARPASCGSCRPDEAAAPTAQPSASPSTSQTRARSADATRSAASTPHRSAPSLRDHGQAAVVCASAVHVDAAAGTITVGRTVLRAGDVVTIDGTSGAVVAGDAKTTQSGRPPCPTADRPGPTTSPERLPSRAPAHERLAAAHAVIGPAHAPFEPAPPSRPTHRSGSALTDRPGALLVEANDEHHPPRGGRLVPRSDAPGSAGRGRSASRPPVRPCHAPHRPRYGRPAAARWLLQRCRISGSRYG